MIKKSLFLLIFISLVFSTFLLFNNNRAFPSYDENPILFNTDLPGFYLYRCTSSVFTWAPWALDEIESLKKEKYVPDNFNYVEEYWFSEPPEILHEAQSKKSSEQSGYYGVRVQRYILPSSKDALDWLKIAFKVNYFTTSSGDLFEERSFTGKKIGDKCFIFREDKMVKESYTPNGGVTTIDPQKAWEGYLNSSSKMLYFIKNNTVVWLSIHYVEGKDGTKEISATWIESLAETICARL